MKASHPVQQLVAVEHDPFAGAALARVVPTTEAQREIWLADQLSRDASLAYNESISLYIDGQLDVAAMERALSAVAARHDALRATFGPDGLSMLVAAQGDMPMRHVDFGGLDAAAREAALAELRVEAVESPFDLAQGPLIRAVLASSGRERHELIITGHHIVCDGWAIGVLAKELMALYSKHAGAGSAKPLPPAESYADYALAQHDDAHCAVADTDNRWFAAQYTTLPNPLDLPADRQRKSVRQFDSRREERIIEPPLVEAIKRFGSQHGASLFVTLFAVYGALLARLSGQSDLVVGVPAAGQAAEGSFGLVGHCVQLLPIRIAVEVDGPFIDLLAATRQRVLDAYEHQSCTFGSLLKTLPIERDASRLPLVSVLFNLDAAIRSEELSVAGLRVHLRSNPRRYENFELFLNACQNEDEIILEAQYGASLFDAATIARWLELYCECLRRVVAGPSRPVDEALAPTAGDQELLQRFNDSALDYPRGQRIEAMIARQATATPEAIAVVAGDRRLTYRELDGRATALAHRLRERGAAPGDLVGLYCGRNEHMVVALLGILKSGAGYVPMDPSFPADRLAYMSEDAKARLIVSDASVDGPWAFPNSERIAADEEIASPVTFAPAGTADNVAYVIYTSGSTGRPKGVRVPHRSVGNLLASVTREPGMTNADSVLSVTTLSFDIAVSEVILPLTVGARIVVADRAQVTDGDRLRELIERERVDWIDATPSTWRLLLASGWTGGVSIKAICTGEPLPPDLGRELLPRVGELWNGYGPTETTVWSSFFRVKAIDGPVPIGRPVANTQFHVVDARQRTLPVGVSGELFIGGEGVTLGYLERPDLTAERFLADPHRPGHCWYRTGDLGRWRSDGILECHGRIDHQIKLRGYRIELGEIEANLATHPQVDRALVVVREDTPGDARLVAYIVARGEPPAADALREHLRRTLPDYMLPQNVVVLSAIPLLPNGKIDRKSLPAPEASVVGGAKRAKEAPRNALEQAVLAAIEQILHLRDLGIDDDFFRMGGHSLLAAKLVATLNRDMKIKLPLRSVFEAPTARSLAGAVAAAVSSGQPARPPIRHEPGRQSAPLTPMQERVRFVETMQPGRLLYNTPTAHQLVGPFDHALFVQAFEEMVRRQPSLRTCIAPDDSDGFVQQVFEQVAIEMPVQDLSHLDEPSRDAEFRRRVQAIVDTPTAIESAPLFRCALYRLEPQKHVFFFMAHHIVWDGWSFDLLYQEMSAIYGALVAGEPHRLPPLAATYGDYAFWLREWLAGPEAAEQLEYWRKRFAVRPQLRALRPDHARRGGMSGAGGVVHARIDPDTVVRLNNIATDAGVTLNMLALAVYAASIVDAAGLEALAVGVPLRGRLMHEIEPVMGFFNNTLPVDVTLNRDGTVADYLRSVKGQLLEMFARQDIPFEVLAADAEIGRRVSKDGFYQVMFSFQSARDRPRQWGPLEELQIPFVQKGATEDMGLWLRDDVDGLKGAFIYNADLFDRSTIDACKTRFLELLERLIANPRQKVAAWCAADGSSAGATLRRLAPERGAAEANLPSAGGGAGRDWKRSELEAVIATTWADILGVSIDDIGPESGFFEIGGSSLLAMNVVTSLEKRLGKRVSPAMLIEAPTVPKLAAAIAASPRPESLVSIRAGTSDPAVFMIHDGDGATLLYRNLAYRLRGDRPLYGLQPLVDEHGVLQHTRIEEMATHYVETMRRVQPEGPYLVGGLCAGGVIAFEVALQLQKLGASVGMVALIDAADVTISESATSRYGTRFKRLTSALTEVSDLPLPQRISRTVGIVARKARNVISYEASSRVEEARRANEVRQMQSRLDNDGATRPSDAQVTFRQIYDVAAREYRQSDRLQGNVVLFRATRGMGDQGDRPLAEISSDPTLGWQAHVVEPIRCVDIAGGHSSMLQEPNVDELAAAMQSCIDNALEGLRARCSAPPELP